MKLEIFKLTSFCLALSACSTLSGPGQRAIPVGSQVTLAAADPAVGTYVSVPKGFSTSSYWIEGPTGLILIDTQFLLSAGEQAVDWAEKATGKKVVLAIILHPNPDKFNGTENLQKRGIKVVTSQQVAGLIPDVHKDRHYWFYDRYKPDYPDRTPQPEVFGSKTTELEAGGIKVTAHVLKAGCSGAHVVVEYNHHLFVGDLIANLGHSWLELGLVDEWLQRMEELKKLNPEFIHPGRGPSGGPELIDREKQYLLKVKTAVLKAHPRKKISDDEREKILGKIYDQLILEYPGYGQEHFLEIGLPEVWSYYAR